jgi:hypothetical protein
MICFTAQYRKTCASKNTHLSETFENHKGFIFCRREIVQKKIVIKGFRSFAPRFGITAVCWPGLIHPLEFVFFPHALLYRAISMHHGARTSHHVGMPPALVGSSV